ncbi:DsbA family protein [Streptomyces roseoverticillatus]|uniref:DsbA family protein n=1 Tax=Streptomyces roseoverticillatus TaxID=66429 RepID=UPI001F239AC3|nr:DsbA family protein [Streptomyces roseoverticillatus]MCF3104670.1 DsbA family protein [Streptomyces roseoverticillatus]
MSASSSKASPKAEKTDPRATTKAKSRPKGKGKAKASVSLPRRIAALGAILALVAALVAVGMAIGKSGGDSGKRGPSASGDPSADPMQGAYARAEQATSRRKDGDPLALGRKDAPVVLVEYADYQCSYCGKFTRDSQPELVRKYVDQGVLRIEFRNFPIFGKDSERAARASWAAGQQGKFWQFHDEVYAKLRKGDALAEDKLADMAGKAGVTDIDRFRSDLNGSASEEAVKKDQEEGYGLGVTSTPSFLVGGRPIAGAQPMAAFDEAIAQARAAAAKKSEK